MSDFSWVESYRFFQRILIFIIYTNYVYSCTLWVRPIINRMLCDKGDKPSSNLIDDGAIHLILLGRCFKLAIIRPNKPDLPKFLVSALHKRRETWKDVKHAVWIAWTVSEASPNAHPHLRTAIIISYPVYLDTIIRKLAVKNIFTQSYKPVRLEKRVVDN